MKITIDISDRELEDCRKAYELWNAVSEQDWDFKEYLIATYSHGGYRLICKDIDVYS